MIKREITELRKKLEEQGYINLSDFMKRSGCSVTMETARRAIYEDMAVTDTTMINLMKHLGYTANEIKQNLINNGEENISSLIGDQNIHLAIWEEELLSIMNELRENSGIKDWNTLIDSIRTAGRLINKDYTERLQKLYITE